MESNIKVSVIIPVYNSEEWLPECLESILRQKLHDIEIICVDDASTDRSSTIIHHYAEQDKRIRLITQPQNSGQALARNVGLAAASGEYVYFLDSDDMVTEAWSKLYPYAKANKADGLLFNQSLLFESKTLEERVRNEYSTYQVTEKFSAQAPLQGEDFFVATELIRYGHCQPGRYMWRREYLQAHGIKNAVETHPHEDTLFAVLAIVQAERMISLNIIGHIYRMRENSSVTSASAANYIKRCHGSFAAWVEMLAFAHSYPFRNEACHKAVLQYSGNRLNLVRRLLPKLSDLERENIHFDDQVYEIYFQNVFGNKPSSSRKTSSMPATLPLKNAMGAGGELFTILGPKCLWAKDVQECHALLGRLKIRLSRQDVIVLEKEKEKWGTVWEGIPVCSPQTIDSSYVVIYDRYKPDSITQGMRCFSVDMFLSGHVSDKKETLVAVPEKKTLPQKGVRPDNVQVHTESMASRSVWKHRPHTLLRFEVQLAEQCNLNCKGCTHYAPIAEPEFLDLDEYGRDLARLAELFDHECRWIHLMGGEPLLHPDIARVIRLTREHFSWGKIMVVTNGLLLGQMKEDFWQACRECQVEISATKYPVACDYDKHREKARREGVRFTFYNGGQSVKTLNRYPLSQTGHQHVEDSFLRCFSSNRCLALRHGRIYGCDMAAYAHHLIKKFDLPLHESRRDSIDIYKAKSAEEIMEHCAKPIPFCRYCNVPGQTDGEPFCQSRRDRYEWIDFEGTEQDWQYLQQFKKVYICTDGSQGQRLQWQCQERGMDSQILDSMENVKSVSNIEGAVFFLAFRNKQKRQEAEQALWEKKASHVIPTAEPPDGGHG